MHAAQELDEADNLLLARAYLASRTGRNSKSESE
jgi:hypothetical protein